MQGYVQCLDVELRFQCHSEFLSPRQAGS